MFGDIFHLINGGPCAFYRIFPHVLQSKAHETLWSGGPTRTSLLKASLYNLKRDDASSCLVPPSHEGLIWPFRTVQVIIFFRLRRKEAVSPGIHKFHILKRLSCEARTASLSTGLLSGDLYWRQGTASWGRGGDPRNTQNWEKLCSVARIAWEIDQRETGSRMALQNFHITQLWVKIH